MTVEAGRDHGLRTINRGVHGCGIDERFENRAGGPLRQSVIQLAKAVIASADESENCSGMRIEYDHRHLRLRAGENFGLYFLADLLALGAHLFDLLIDQLHSHLDGLRRRLLQVGIERSVDAIGLVVEIMFGELLQQRVAHHVDEIGRVAGFHVRRGELQRCGLGLLRLLARDGVGIDHGIEHQIAALESTLRMAIRRQAARSLNNAREQRGFRERDVFQIFIEVCLRGFRESADRE